MKPLFRQAKPEPGDGFGDECREAFLRLIAERDAINLSEPTKRCDNGKKWLAKHNAINDVLDQYNDWREIQAL